MFWRSVSCAAVAAAVAAAGAGQAHAKIRCDGPFQIVRGQGKIATPYCQDAYVGQVARSYGIQVSDSAIRRNPSRKEEVCRVIGHDSRIYEECLKFRNDGPGSRF